MDSHGYDATGLSSSLLAAGLLIPTIAAVYFVSDTHKPKNSCNCRYCAQGRKKGRVNKQKVLLVALILLLIVPIYNILFKEYGKNTNSNPYKLLNISNSATEKEIEKAYRKSVRKAKLMKIDKTEEKELVQKVLKAKDLLLDREARERWDSFGDAPVVNSHMVAIPSWLMTKYNPLILIVLYVVVLAIVLPKSVSYIWMYSFEYSSSGILYKSTESLYRALKHTEVDDILGLLVLLNKYTVELSSYTTKTPKTDIEKLQKLIKTTYAIALPLDTDTFTLSVAVLLLRDRVVHSLIRAQDIEYLQNRLVLSSHAIRTLAIAFKAPSLFYLAVDLERCVVQSVPDPQYYQMQAGIPFKNLFVAQYKKAPVDENTQTDRHMFKAEISGIDIYNPIDSVVRENSFITGTTDTIVKVSISKEQNKKYVPVTIQKSGNKTSDTGDLADLEHEPEELYPHSLDKHPIKIKGSQSVSVHSPLYFDDALYSWICVLELNGEILMETPDFTPSSSGTEIFFKVPGLKNILAGRKADMQVKLVCCNYFNRNSSKTLSFLIK